MVISHEAIYKSLFVRSRGVLDHQLTKRLRTRRPTRRNVHNTTTGQWRSQIKNAVSIHDRPAHVETREEVGHWEGDMLLGRHWTQIATLVERTSGYTICLELASRHTSVVVDAIINRIGNAPDGLFKSLTWDRGMELADHQRLTEETSVPVFFCDSRSPWQRGTNENTNGLLRQYLPKGESMAGLTQADFDAIAAKLNRRPRKRLEFATPSATLATVALTLEFRDADFRIALARLRSRFSCSSCAIRRCSAVLCSATVGVAPLVISSSRTHLRTVSRP